MKHMEQFDIQKKKKRKKFLIVKTAPNRILNYRFNQIVY